MLDRDGQPIPMRRFIVQTSGGRDIGVIAHKVDWGMHGLYFSNHQEGGSYMRGQRILGCMPGAVLFFRELGEDEWPPSVAAVYSASGCVERAGS